MSFLTHLGTFAMIVCECAFAQNIGVTVRQQDLNFVANQLPVLNPNYFFQLDRAQFQQAVANLSSKVSTTTDAEFYVGLAQIVAMGGDAHTILPLNGSYTAALGFKTLPLSFVWLDDGVFVTAALQTYARAVGAQLTAVGGTPIDQVVQQLGTVISHENDNAVQDLSQLYLAGQQILQGLHIAPAGGTISMTFRTLAGVEFALDVAPGDGELATAPNAQTGPIPDYLRLPDPNYWYAYFPENRLLYFKYNRCLDDPSNPFAAFAAQVLATLDSNPVDSFVWDFRGNGGGNTNVYQALGLGLYQRLPRLLANPRFGFYVAIDKGTFSAAMTNAMQLKQPLPGLNLGQITRLIGQPTGGKPAYHGNIQTVNLPGSKLLLQYSTVTNPAPAWIPDLPALMPDIPVGLRSSSYFARYDPVMAAILARTGAPSAPPSGGAITVNGASFRADEGIAPGSFASVFGAFSSTPDQVLVAGVKTSIFSSTKSQVNFLVPPAIAPGPATVSVRSADTEVASGTVSITASAPGLFILNPADPSQPGAVENQDYSVNSATNPAQGGSVVQIFATGYGPLDGSAPAQVFFGDSPANILFSGPLAQFPGLWQINAQVPNTAAGQVPLFVIEGSLASNAVTIYVR
jgi:uncharacterized protein (TIGR03437 family)